MYLARLCDDVTRAIRDAYELNCKPVRKSNTRECHWQNEGVAR